VWADRALVRTLVDGMTFAQQQYVTASDLFDVTATESVTALIESQRLVALFHSPTDRQSFGPTVAEDSLWPLSRGEFLRSFVRRFRVELPNDHFRKAFFYQIEISRLSRPLVELHYFLAFSGLEILARNYGRHGKNKRAAVPISCLLSDHGFANDPAEVQRWADARNNLFHRGVLSSPSHQPGIEIKLTDYLMTVSNVLTDLLLKMLPFDDGHINWNRWRDRQAWC
jgi:hypothetical protein